MSKPGDASPCCKDKGGRVSGVNPGTRQRTWDPVKEIGKLYCTACQENSSSK
jgi:hypothetical protein